MITRLGQCATLWLFRTIVFCLLALAPTIAISAPYAAFVIDARTGKVLHASNADTRLHPASLTKMMTLYITFEAIKKGEISLDTMVRISKNAAAEPPSKLGLRAGQRIKLRYLIRAAAVKSANDAATAIGEAVGGSETEFVNRMNRTAKALGMTRTTFKNANGLTRSGHLSTARDMTTLGRHLFYDYPDYYNLFSRKTADAGMRDVRNTNRRLLSNYTGADGIKTGYTRAAGFNLVASAQRGNERIIATVFGGRSGSSRNARVAELLDMGFARAPSKATVRKPALPVYKGGPANQGKTLRIVRAVKKSPRPNHRPGATPAPSQDLLLAIEDSVSKAVAEAAKTAKAEVPAAAPDKAGDTQLAAATVPETTATAPTRLSTTPPPRPAELQLASVTPDLIADTDPVVRRVVTRMSTSGGRLWGINVGRYNTRNQAERVLLKTALTEMTTLDGALRKVSNQPRGWEANFVGMTKEMSALACRRLEARGVGCTTLGPG